MQVHDQKLVSVAVNSSSMQRARAVRLAALTRHAAAICLLLLAANAKLAAQWRQQRRSFPGLCLMGGMHSGWSSRRVAAHKVFGYRALA